MDNNKKSKYSVLFELKQKSPKSIDIDYSFNFGVLKIKAHKKNSCLIVENVKASNVEQANQIATEKTNKMLDELAYDHNIFLEIKQPALKIVRRTGSNSISTTQAKNLTYEVQEKSSNSPYIKFKMDDTNHVKSGSYYRKAKLSKNPFEKFRNFYLIVENIGHKIKPCVSDSELLKETMPYVFKDKDKNKSLKKVAKDVSVFKSSSELYENVHKLLYKSNRCAINHAKKNMKVPYNPQDEQYVSASLPLMRFVAEAYIEYKKNN